MLQNLRIVILHERELWVAVCLESFIAVQDKTPFGVVPKMIQALQSHIEIAKLEGATPFECFPPAPKEFWDKFEAASWRLSPVA